MIVAIPDPLFASPPCRESWNLIDENHATMIFSTTFQKGVKETNPTIIAAPLWKEDNDFPFHLLRHAPLLANGLHQPNKDAPFVP